MKLQSIVLFLTASLSTAIYAQAVCTIFYKGLYRHQTGDTGGGCFGADPSDSITTVSTADPADACYTFYSGYGCTGSVVGSGCGSTTFPGIKFSSIKLLCK
ncbi:250_t:CDS:2 [Ambispora gerdemannii]|uniref:250_t:CDS:1 n=1 Tax=Ambispora gerdemannii TaxID=144530 RepID=A0A9N9FMQ6_9GLOM|nr:250_t:CDS:2 [Ambispora gerdemannii]